MAEALEELSGKSVGIKWVNDLLMDGKKVCGILSEASLDCESGTVNYVIVGVGINVRRPEGGFPEELRDIAGAAFGDESIPDLRCRLAASVLDRLWRAYEHREDGGVLEAYRKRSLVLGRPINILPREGEPERATALEIEPDFALRVRLEYGNKRQDPKNAVFSDPVFLLRWRPGFGGISRWPRPGNHKRTRGIPPR